MKRNISSVQVENKPRVGGSKLAFILGSTVSTVSNRTPLVFLSNNSPGAHTFHTNVFLLMFSKIWPCLQFSYALGNKSNLCGIVDTPKSKALVSVTAGSQGNHENGYQILFEQEKPEASNLVILSPYLYLLAATYIFCREELSSICLVLIVYERLVFCTSGDPLCDIAIYGCGFITLQR
jgi:hypothetical protein